MGRKIFVSYKYHDNDVANFDPLANSRVRGYVDWIEDNFDSHSEHIYKGKHDEEDLSYADDDYIWSRLKR